MAQYLSSGDKKSRQAQADAVNRVLDHLPDRERYVIANRYYASAGFEKIAEWMEGEVTPTEVEEFSERGLSLLADLDEGDLAVLKRQLIDDIEARAPGPPPSIEQTTQPPKGFIPHSLSLMQRVLLWTEVPLFGFSVTESSGRLLTKRYLWECHFRDRDGLQTHSAGGEAKSSEKAYEALDEQISELAIGSIRVRDTAVVNAIADGWAPGPVVEPQFGVENLRPLRQFVPIGRIPPASCVWAEFTDGILPLVQFDDHDAAMKMAIVL